MICDKPTQASYAPVWDKVTDALATPRATLTSLDLPMTRMIRAMRRQSLPLLLMVAAAVALVRAALSKAASSPSATAIPSPCSMSPAPSTGFASSASTRPNSASPAATAPRDSLSRLVYERDVRVEWIKKDQYGRFVGKVWVAPADCPLCGPTLDAGLAQITMGRAWWFRRFARDQCLEDRGRYEFAEQEAQGRKAGLWGSGNPVPPWEWRRPRQ